MTGGVAQAGIQKGAARAGAGAAHPARAHHNLGLHGQRERGGGAGDRVALRQHNGAGHLFGGSQEAGVGSNGVLRTREGGGGAGAGGGGRARGGAQQRPRPPAARPQQQRWWAAALTTPGTVPLKASIPSLEDRIWLTTGRAKPGVATSPLALYAASWAGVKPLEHWVASGRLKEMYSPLGIFSNVSSVKVLGVL